MLSSNPPSSPHTPLPFLCLPHSLPIQFYFSIPLEFLHISFTPSLTLSFSSVVFLQLVGSERGYRIGIQFCLSNTRENCSKTSETMAMKPLQSADCMCVTPSLCISLLNFLLLCSYRSGMLKGKPCEGVLGSVVWGRGTEYTCGEEKGLCRDLRCAPGGCSVINKALASWREQRCEGLSL